MGKPEKKCPATDRPCETEVAMNNNKGGVSTLPLLEARKTLDLEEPTAAEKKPATVEIIGICDQCEGEVLRTLNSLRNPTFQPKPASSLEA